MRELGVGLTFHPELEGFVHRYSNLIDVIELEPQTFWLPSRTAEAFHAPRGALERIAAFPQAKLVHSIGLPAGGSRLANLKQIPLLQETITRLESPWFSEHLSFNAAGSGSELFFTGFLLPPRLTWEGVEKAVATVSSLAARVNAPLAIETGVSYLRPRDDELSDARFVTEVAEAADCGILLDIHNVWANERNGRQKLESFFDELPSERVWELHLAGGLEHAGYWLDAHSGAIPKEVLQVAGEVTENLPNLGAIIFELMPEQIPRLGDDGLRRQLDALHVLWTRRPSPLAKESAKKESGGTSTIGSALPYERSPGCNVPAPQTWEDTLGALAVGLPTHGKLANELASDPGMGVIRELVDEARAAMLSASLRLTIRLLLLELGETQLRDVLKSFWTNTLPAAFAADEGLAFGEYLRGAAIEVPYLDDVLAFEMATLQATVSDEVVDLTLQADPGEVLGALAAGRLPKAIQRGSFSLQISAGMNDEPDTHRAGARASPVG
jgi:uncharacterized protein (UPF0276 family)